MLLSDVHLHYPSRAVLGLQHLLGRDVLLRGQVVLDPVLLLVAGDTIDRRLDIVLVGLGQFASLLIENYSNLIGILLLAAPVVLNQLGRFAFHAAWQSDVTVCPRQGVNVWQSEQRNSQNEDPGDQGA